MALKNINARIMGYYVLILTLFLATMCPPIAFCWDEYIIPKWTLSIIALLCLFAYVQNSGIPIRKVIFSGLLCASLLSVIMEFAYVCKELITEREIVLCVGAHGTFDTPAGLALHICLMIAVIKESTKRIRMHSMLRILLYGVSGAAVVCLLLSHSRAGFFSLLIMVTAWIWNRLRALCTKICIIIAMAAAIVVIASSYKSDSTCGRFFIMSNTATIIGRHLFFGGGPGCFEKEYMLEQASYFKNHKLDKNAILADDIQHPLNEFAYVWVQYGIVGAVLLLFCLFYCRFNMLSLCIFPFLLLSYPLSYPFPWIALLGNVVLRFSAFMPIYNGRICKTCVYTCFVSTFILWCYFLSVDIRMSSAMGSSKRQAHSHAVRKYSDLAFEMKAIPTVGLHQKRMSCWIYNYTYELFQTQNFDEALSMYGKSRKLFTSYDNELLVADILYHKSARTSMHDSLIKMSEFHYKLAHNMCPVRFAPLEGMMNLYSLDETNQYKADSVAHRILEKPIKIPSIEVNNIKAEAESILKEHSCKYK